jgi:hypothetical protein
MIKNVSIDNEVIHISTTKKEIKFPLNSIDKIYINKDNDFWISLFFTVSFAIVSVFINYLFLNNVFFLNVLLVLIFLLIVKEYVIKQKAKYYIVIVTLDNKEHVYRFKSDIKYDAFYVKDQFNLFNQLNSNRI